MAPSFIFSLALRHAQLICITGISNYFLTNTDIWILQKAIIFLIYENIHETPNVFECVYVAIAIGL